MDRDGYSDLGWRVLGAFSTLAQASQALVFGDAEPETRDRSNPRYLDTFSAMRVPGTAIPESSWSSEPVGKVELTRYLSITGSFKHVGRWMGLIHGRGIQPDLRPVLWPYLLGVFEWRSSREQVEDKTARLKQEYTEIKAGWAGETSEDVKRVLEDRQRVIIKDVVRTDRSVALYSGECMVQGNALSHSQLNVLKDVLTTVCFYEEGGEYFQEMCDLLSPILYVVRDEALAFWCLVGLIKRRGEFSERRVRSMLHLLSKLARVLLPDLYRCLERGGLLEMVFCYRWLAVDFKRELGFHGAMELWERLWSNPYSSDYILFLCVGMLEQHAEALMRQESLEDAVQTVNRPDGPGLEQIFKSAEHQFHRFRYLVQFIDDPDLRSINLGPGQ